MRHQLVGLLGRPVEADGMVDVLVDRQRHRAVEPVDGAGRGVDKVPDAAMPAALEDIQEAGDVAFRVEAGLRDRMAHPGLGGKMDDIFRPMVLEDAGNRGLVDEVGLVKGELGLGREQAQARPLELRVIVVVYVVQAVDGVAVAQEALDDVKSGGVCRFSWRRE